MPWWYKTWQRSGYNHNHVNHNLPRRPTRTSRSSWSRRGNPKLFILTIPWNLASLARNHPGNIVRQHHTDQKQIGLLKEQCVERKRGHLRCSCSPVWVTNGGLILWKVTPICETSQISLDGKTPYERRFGMPFDGPLKLFEAMVEYHPISAKD